MHSWGPPSWFPQFVVDAYYLVGIGLPLAVAIQLFWPRPEKRPAPPPWLPYNSERDEDQRSDRDDEI